MTIEEAIDYNKNLRMYMKISDKNQLCKFLEENYTALDMAIKSLEAWGKVKKEIKFIKEAEIQVYGKASWNFSGKCLAVIDKHLAEVGE